MKFSKSKFAVLGLAALLAAAGARAAESEADSQIQAIEDLRGMLGNTVVQLNELKSKADNGVNFGVNADLRYDFQKWNSFSGQDAAGYAANGRNYVKTPVTDGAPNGAAGMYAKRIEVEFKAKTASWAMWHLQFEFAALKLEDLGVELNDLALIPGLDPMSWSWNMKVGQFRQPFGIEQQTGSSSIAFSERAMMYGGANPAGAPKLVSERVMGLHALQQKDFGPIGYKLQFSVANDTGDQNPGTASLGGTQFLNTTQTAFSTAKSYPFLGQRTDQDPGEFGRLGVDLNFFPKIAKLNLGASAIHNSANSVYFATSSTTEAWSDVFGADATVQVDSLNWKVWGEWLGSNSFDGIKGLTNRAEGWYVTSSLQPLKFFMKDAPMLDLNIRYENDTPKVDAAANLASFVAGSAEAITYGLKWSYVGKNYTSINYSIYGLNGDFTALAGTEFLVLQQQFNF